MIIRNKIKIMQMLAFIFISFIIAGCMQQQNMNNTGKTESEDSNSQSISDVNILSFETDKKIYGSYEEIKVTAVVKSHIQIQDINARLTGIKPYNYDYIDKSKVVDINSGEKEIIFFVKTPHCTSGCGGVYPGPYSIDIELTAGEEVLASSSTTIELVSG